jgi:hypothetical protein
MITQGDLGHFVISIKVLVSSLMSSIFAILSFLSGI